MICLFKPALKLLSAVRTMIDATQWSEDSAANASEIRTWQFHSISDNDVETKGHRLTGLNMKSYKANSYMCDDTLQS